MTSHLRINNNPTGLLLKKKHQLVLLIATLEVGSNISDEAVKKILQVVFTPSKRKLTGHGTGMLYRAIFGIAERSPVKFDGLTSIHYGPELSKNALQALNVVNDIEKYKLAIIKTRR
ncbi:uncharacterized protein ATC70_005912 [Mucor velutinosus]|uniref:Uncharacterized protein n=1 Tax=Mucor velutinosus TaxID=708070 RepID=A0AAN7HSF4_9FUNG|nr:hypothetical protein ATC70_005912 [Mucor velutinosus]